MAQGVIKILDQAARKTRRIRNETNADVGALERDLRERVRGEVHFGDAYRAMYSTDAANYRQVPIAVVLPLDADDAQGAMESVTRTACPSRRAAGERA